MLNRFFRLNNIAIAITSVIAIAFFMFIGGCQQRHQSDLKIKFHEQYQLESQPQVDDIVRVNLSYGLKDTVLFNSSSLIVPMEFPIIDNAFSGDLYDGLTTMSRGDSVTITVVADSFFIVSAGLSRIPPFVTTGEDFYYHVKLLDFYDRITYDSLTQVRKDEKLAEEMVAIDNFLATLESDYDILPSGLIKVLEKSGNGNLPDSGDMCQVYIEVRKLMGDTMFSNFGKLAFDIEFGKKFDNPGFMEGLGLMREGEISRLIIPSPIGVGENGYDGVSGYTTLDYTVYFIKIRPLEVVKRERQERAEQKRRIKN